MNALNTATLTTNERDLMGHVQMFGLPGYPVRKIGARWFWVDAFGVKGAPSPFRTKREAVERFEIWIGLKRAVLGEEAKARAIADHKARGFTDAQIAELIAAAERAA